MNANITQAQNSGGALLLIGSPRGKASTSHVFGSYLARKLEAGGMETREMTVSEGLRSDESLEQLFRAMDSAGLVIVSFPLYVDQLPAPLIQALGLFIDWRRKKPAAVAERTPRPKIMAIVQCGFPETMQNQPALDIMRGFAAKAGYEWAGGLAAGMGGAVGGKPLEKAGGMAKNIIKAFDLAAASILAGGIIPEKAVTLMGKPLMPRWLYLLAANFGMKSQARKHGAAKSLYARPYEPLS
jgi:hypothetical protein